MARGQPNKTNFSSGELSPLLLGRTDIDQYQNGAETLTNFHVIPQGGIERRFGTIFVSEVKDSTKKVRLIPFIFSSVQAYILEFGDTYVRFYRNGIQIEDPPSTPVEMATPYLEAELFELEFTQSADVLYIVHPNHEPAKITRTAHITWTITEIDFIDGPYLDINIDTADTLTLSGGPPWTTGSTLTLTAVGHTPFLSTHVGAIWRLQNDAAGSDTTYVKVTAFSSSTVVTVTTEDGVPLSLQATATSFWLEGAWSDVQGFPRSVCFFEQRLVFGGSTNQPQNLWGSAQQSFEDFTPGTDAADPFTFIIASTKVDVISWLSPLRSLLIGTSGSISRIQGTGGPLSSTNVDVKTQSGNGAKFMMPVVIGNLTLFMQLAGRKLRQMFFEFARDGYIDPDLTILAEHITEGTVIEMDYQAEPRSILWCVKNDGDIAIFTFERDENVFAWSLDTTNGDYESVAVIPNTLGTEDEVWVVVKRTINSVTKRYVEFVKPNIQTDSTLEFSGASTKTISGLDHLEAETVEIIADGSVHPDKTVSSGSITLDRSVTTAEIGLGYDSLCKLLRPEFGNPAGTSQGRKKRFSEIILRLKDTLGGEVNGQPLIFTKGGDPMDTPPPKFTGDKSITNLGYDRDANITIEQKQPLPMTLLSVTGTLNVGQ